LDDRLPVLVNSRQSWKVRTVQESCALDEGLVAGTVSDGKSIRLSWQMAALAAC